MVLTNDFSQRVFMLKWDNHGWSNNRHHDISWYTSEGQNANIKLMVLRQLAQLLKNLLNLSCVLRYIFHIHESKSDYCKWLVGISLCVYPFIRLIDNIVLLI